MHQDSLFKKFSKDYLYYFLGVIIPAVINFSIIPIVKKLIGDTNYGEFTLYYTAFLFLSFSIAGGASHTMIRFYPLHKNEPTYFSSILKLSLTPLFFLAIPLFFLLVFYYNQSVLFSSLFLLNLCLAFIQATALSFAQAQLKSNYILIGEAIRTILFLGSTVVILKITKDQNLYKEALFMALSIAYFLSGLYLFYYQRLIKQLVALFSTQFYKNKLSQTVIQYWKQMTLWFLIVYLYSFADRFFVDFYLKDKALVGNFSAVNDIIIRGIAILITPILTAAFPLVVKTHETDQKNKVHLFLNKLIFLEIICLAITMIVYWAYGKTILKSLLHISATYEQVLQNGYLIIVGCFLWQIAMLIHKPLELAFNTKRMLLAAGAALLLSIFLNFTLISHLGIYASGVSLIVGAITYISISFSTRTVKVRNNQTSVTNE